MKNAYTCACKNETFSVIDKRINYRGDKRIEPVLACAKCGRHYNPQFVNDGGLTKPKTTQTQ